MNNVASFCFATIVASRALEAIHESGSSKGSFRDRHPWRVARELLHEASTKSEVIPILFAVEETQKLADWAVLVDIDVATFSGSRYETLCSFNVLQPVNPIFEELSSVLLKPSLEQLQREALEPIRHYRQHLDLQSIRPYAICETPSFISGLGASNQSTSASES